jgi:hypothetical protein
MRKIYLAILGLILSGFMASCAAGGINSPAVTPPVNPEKGKATVTGRVISSIDGSPYVNTLVRLAEVYREGDRGAYALDQAFSPGAKTDANGFFIFENITAREYVLVIGDVMKDYKIYPDNQGKPQVWNAEPDKVLNMGLIKTDLVRGP